MISFFGILFFGSLFLMFVNRRLNVHLRKRRAKQLEMSLQETQYIRDIEQAKNTEQTLRDQVEQSNK